MNRTQTAPYWAAIQEVYRRFVVDINQIDRTQATVGDGNIVLTLDYGLWVDGKLVSHPALGPALAAREARQRVKGGSK